MTSQAVIDSQHIDSDALDAALVDAYQRSSWRDFRTVIADTGIVAYQKAETNARLKHLSAVRAGRATLDRDWWSKLAEQCNRRNEIKISQTMLVAQAEKNIADFAASRQPSLDWMVAA
jgi:hypothetical protein